MKITLTRRKETTMIRLENVSKVFHLKNKDVEALKHINLTIEDGSIFGIIGSSGAGKSTLVRCLNLLERPTEGNVFLDDVELTALSQSGLRKERRRIGMVFQQFNLLAQRTALKNVCYPLEIAGVSAKQTKERAIELLKLVGLEERMYNYPAQLSGGQKQRVAIARALATEPKYLLCDEATSALDPNTTNSILDLLKEINERLGITIVVITHEMKVVEKICTRVAVLNEGEIIEQGSVQEVFLSPKTKTAQEMIYPKQKYDNRNLQGRVFRLAFGGQSSTEPIVANLVLKCQAPVNILGAGTEDIGGKAYGQMLLEFPADETVIDKAKKYLDALGVHYEEEVGDGD
ncbi:MAG: ATP-binding cassette domain-containing protein [Bacteroides sp.]|nr:ATP-binding cassette domain-containing protein [Bacteroides sp.]MCM1550476.1 ATP-binding cassette domain-containing protein [Clostridium sp.]